MTISGRGSESSAEPPAEAGPEGTVPENEQELRQEIEQTRERLGDTVELLVAKTDIKGRAQAKVAGLAGRMKGRPALARSKAADGVRSQVAGKTLLARQRAAAGRDQLQARASGAWQAAPESVRRTVTMGASTARQGGWVPLAVVAALLALGSGYSGYLAFQSWQEQRPGG